MKTNCYFYFAFILVDFIVENSYFVFHIIHVKAAFVLYFDLPFTLCTTIHFQRRQ